MLTQGLIAYCWKCIQDLWGKPDLGLFLCFFHKYQSALSLCLPLAIFFLALTQFSLAFVLLKQHSSVRAGLADIFLLLVLWYFVV